MTVTLPGHGPEAFYPASYQAPQHPERLATEPSPLAAVTMEDYAERVSGVVRRISERHGPVILAAHADGGGTMHLVADAVPGHIARLVYLAAGCCTPELPTLGDFATAPENAEAVVVPVTGDPAALGVSRINWRTADAETLATFKAALAAGHSDTEFRAVLNSLQPDEPVAAWGTDVQGNPRTWGRIPRTYVRFTEDRTYTPELQDRMIANADALTPDNPFTVASVPAPHVGPLHRPDIVDILAALPETAN